MGGDAQGAAASAPDPKPLLVAGRQKPDGETVVAAEHGVGGKAPFGDDAQRALAPDLLERPALALDLDASAPFGVGGIDRGGDDGGEPDEPVGADTGLAYSGFMRTKTYPNFIKFC